MEPATALRTGAARTARLPGLVYGVLGAALWGLSGVAAQDLFHHHVTAQWLVTMRMLVGGGALYAWLRPPLPRTGRIPLVVFAVAGLAAVQYAYLAAIAASNAATATFIQNLFVPMTALYEVVVAGRRLTPQHLAALVLALLGLLGLCLLILAGTPGHVSVRLTPPGLLFGLLAAVTAAGYTLMSAALVPRHGARTVTTWGLLIGGAACALWTLPWVVHADGNVVVVAGLTLFVALAGTAAAFGLFLAGMRTMTATEGAITVTVEPIVAALASLVLLGVTLYPPQYVGGALILLAVMLLRRAPG